MGISLKGLADAVRPTNQALSLEGIAGKAALAALPQQILQVQPQTRPVANIAPGAAALAVGVPAVTKMTPALADWDAFIRQFVSLHGLEGLKVLSGKAIPKI